ncbi:E3 ubiquitin-protein ligase ubr1 [Paramarasmius palmivorus]|uniref:E3 ubiquitin-protein ligase n=1 Tax=Paramarasmius palmivorus TaxID=297713 RepID=A0AAW0D884_9AGAR
MNTRERATDPLSHLRFTLETMPGQRKYSFTAATRAEILSELYDAFWGSYAHLFLPLSNSSLPMHATLSEVQASVSFCGAGKDGPVAPGRPCAHVLKKGESCFRCKDCALDDSCVICSRCFHATDHEGHNVSFFIAQQSGGCCDCGDEEAWRVPLKCPFHPPADRSSEISSQPQPFSNETVPPVKDYPFRFPVPPELRETMARTVGYALDFVLDTLDYSPDEPSVPANEADLRLQPSADPMMKDQYCVIVWNDDKHSFDEVIKLICDLTGRSREEAAEMTQRIDENGREIIDMSTDVPRLLEMAQTIAQIDLGVTIRRAYDTFREQVASVIIEWLVDLTQCRLNTDTVILREIIAEELLAKRKRDNTSAYNAQSLHSLPDLRDPARIDSLFLSHTRLWKKPRLSLKEIYTAVLTLGRNHKLAVAGHFAIVYHRVVDAYLLVDREAETSIKYFALQLFTVPSVATHIVRRYGLITRLLSIITAFFTNQITDKHITHPPDSSITTLDVDTFPFKSKRFMPVFSDLRYLCNNEPVQELIAHNPEFITQFAKTCLLFMCVNPSKRAATSHVEFETDAWISVFNVTLSLSRVIKVYGAAFNRSTAAGLVAAISTVMHNILMVCTLNEDRLDRSKFNPITFHEVVFGDTSYNVVDFDVLDGWVSFHHSLHWLLAELFKHVDLLSEESLRTVGYSSVRDVVLRGASEQAVLTIIDFPLRGKLVSSSIWHQVAHMLILVLAMIAQIRNGLWVRNGFAIRGQLLHYRDFMLRELCYDQDLFMLQVALIILDPNSVIVSILDRFSLLSYFSGAFLHGTYDPTQLSGMVEEVLYVFITILSETASITKMSLECQVRREIVHTLALGPCTYTDLIKRVSERLVEDVCFEAVLRSVSTFKPPETTSDTGLYELKDEMYDEVNPFFYHYTRNKREEVEVILKNRLKKKNPRISEPVLVPNRMVAIEGPFSIITSTFESEALLQVMFYSIYNVLVLTASSGTTPPSGEAILDQVLHLIMLGIVERAHVFCALASVKSFDEEKNLIDVLCTLEHHETFKPYKSRVAWILDEMEKHVSLEIQGRRFVPNTTDAPDPEEIRKRAAKARQEAIMKQMKAQQDSFALNFDDVDDQEDEDMEDAEQQEVTYGTCIVCQENLTAARSFGTLGLIQPSRFIRRQPDGAISHLNAVLQAPTSMDRSQPSQIMTFPPKDADALDAKAGASSNYDGFPNSYTRFGLHASVCSHMMHLDCFHVYSISIRQRHRAQATRNHPETIPRKEYICPLCKSLGNVIIPVTGVPNTSLNTVAFSDWIRSAGISILKSKPDPQLESLQFRNGTGEFVFWSAQDPGYTSILRSQERVEGADSMKMVDTVMIVSKSISQQTRHLRERHEPESGERGAGIYLPEELIGYTIGAIEVAQRGVDCKQGLITDNLSESQMKMIRGLLTVLVKLAGSHFKGRPDEGRDAMQQAIIKRLLPEWSRSSLTSFSFPLLLRDPFTVLVETAAVAPEILRHVLVLTYYACLARTVIGLVFVLNKSRGVHTVPVTRRTHENIFGDVRMFFMSVVRHSPIFEHTATMAFETFGEARIEKFLYSLTLPFLRKAAVLCRSVLPSSFSTPDFEVSDQCEYERLLNLLGIPPLSDLPHQDTLQNALSGWCAHYGHSHTVTPVNFGVTLDMPCIYRLARLPLVLDNLFVDQEKAVICQRCNTIPTDAAICLLCGTTVCFQSTCCTDPDERRGECNMHTRE